MATTPNPAANSGLSDNVASLLGYIFPVNVIFLLIEPFKNSRIVRFHCWQGILFAIASIVIQFALTIFSMILAFVSGALAGIFSLVTMAVSLGILVVWILLLVRAYQGQKWVLPVIGPLAEKQAG